MVSPLAPWLTPRPSILTCHLRGTSESPTDHPFHLPTCTRTCTCTLATQVEPAPLTRRDCGCLAPAALAIGAATALAHTSQLV